MNAEIVVELVAHQGGISGRIDIDRGSAQCNRGAGTGRIGDVGPERLFDNEGCRQPISELLLEAETDEVVIGSDVPGRVAAERGDVPPRYVGAHPPGRELHVIPFLEQDAQRLRRALDGAGKNRCGGQHQRRGARQQMFHRINLPHVSQNRHRRFPVIFGL